MPKDRITLRLPPDLIAFLTAEAGRHGLSLTEYMKNLIARGLRDQETREATEEIKNAIAEFQQGATCFPADNISRLQLEAIFETRELLRELATLRDAMMVTRSKQTAQEEINKLLGDSHGNS